MAYMGSCTLEILIHKVGQLDCLEGIIDIG